MPLARSREFPGLCTIPDGIAVFLIDEKQSTVKNRGRKNLEMADEAEKHHLPTDAPWPFLRLILHCSLHRFCILKARKEPLARAYWDHACLHVLRLKRKPGAAHSI